ncbi:MAG: hypothetical protein SOW30_10265 [Parabacteroides sp.]|nr:hypothetical protein [Parabacteroides sp.]
MEPDNNYIIHGRPRSLLIETSCELADTMLSERHGIPIEDMCDENGEFTDFYQSEFDGLYDSIEKVLVDLWKHLEHGAGED